jgi:phytoene desaturase
MTKSVAIVGAGPGGLAAAMLLAHAGADVTVHERLNRIGGRSSTIEAPSRSGTFRFDMGPTFFLYPRILEEIFATCGRRLTDEVDLIRLDPQYHIMFEGGGSIQATPDLARLTEEVARIAPEDAKNVARFMTDNRAKFAAFKPVLEQPFNSARDLARPSMLRSLRLMRPHRTVDQDLGRWFSDPRIRLAFSFQSKYLGMSPFRCPSLFTILAFMEYEYGVFHPRGGTGSVMAAMARVARDLGVNIKLGSAVDEILFSGRRAVGVRTAEGEQRHDAVVVNADFGHAMRKLVPDRLRTRWTDARIRRKKFSCSTFMLYLGIEGKIDNLSHHTIYLSKNYRRNIDDIERGDAPPADPSFYVQNACVTDPALAPPGHSTLYVLVPVGNLIGGVNWEAESARYRKIALDQIKKIGIPDIEHRIRFEKMFTPNDWQEQLQIHEGATFNLAHSLGQMLHWRPRNRFEDLDGVYLVGGGTHPGSGLPVIFEGARITTRLMAQDLNLDMTGMSAELPMAPRLEPALMETL